MSRNGVQIASRAEEEERLALLEEEARRAKLAADMSDTGMSSQERDKINKLVEEVGHLNYFNNYTLALCPH